jgi:hypothetical protein
LVVESVERLRAEYRRKYGREHPRSCEEAGPSTPCRCGCNGTLHGIKRKQNNSGNVSLERWLYA